MSFTSFYPDDVEEESLFSSETSKKIESTNISSTPKDNKYTPDLLKPIINSPLTATLTHVPVNHPSSRLNPSIQNNNNINTHQTSSNYSSQNNSFPAQNSSLDTNPCTFQDQFSNNSLKTTQIGPISSSSDIDSLNNQTKPMPEYLTKNSFSKPSTHSHTYINPTLRQPSYIEELIDEGTAFQSSIQNRQVPLIPISQSNQSRVVPSNSISNTIYQSKPSMYDLSSTYQQHSTLNMNDMARTSQQVNPNMNDMPSINRQQSRPMNDFSKLRKSVGDQCSTNKRDKEISSQSNKKRQQSIVKERRVSSVSGLNVASDVINGDMDIQDEAQDLEDETEIQLLRTQIKNERETHAYHTKKVAESSVNIVELSNQLEKVIDIQLKKSKSGLINKMRKTSRESIGLLNEIDSDSSGLSVKRKVSKSNSSLLTATFHVSPQKQNPMKQREKEIELSIPKRSKLVHDASLTSKQASNYKGMLESEVIDLETFENTKLPIIIPTLDTREKIRQPQKKKLSPQESISSLNYAPQIKNITFNPRKGFFLRKPRGIMMHPNQNHSLSNILTTSSLDGAIQFTDITTKQHITTIGPKNTQNGWSEDMVWIDNTCIAVAAAPVETLYQHSKDRSIIKHQIMLLSDIRHEKKMGFGLDLKYSIQHVSGMPHEKGIEALCAFPSLNGCTRLVSGGADKRLFLWQFEHRDSGLISAECITMLLHSKHTSSISSVVYCPINGNLYSSGIDAKLFNYSVEKQTILHTQKMTHKINSMIQIQNQPSLLLVSIASLNNQNILYDKRTNSTGLSFGTSNEDAYSKYSSPFVHPNGLTIAMGEAKDKGATSCVMTWDLRYCKLSLPTQIINVHDKRVIRGVFGYEGDTMMTISADNMLGFTEIDVV